MPTYEYACSKCGHHFDAFQSMKDEPLKKCPKCGKPALKRLLGTGAGLIFKGSGFYVTDYKKSGSAGGKESGGSGGKEGGAPKTTESKGSESKSTGGGGEAKSSGTPKSP